MMEGLTSKQEKFIEQFVLLNHVTNATKAAGYSDKTAHVQGSNLLKKLKIQEAVSERRKQLTESLNNKFLTHVEEAILIQLEIMRQEDAPPQTRLNATKDILDRAGLNLLKKEK
jgi:phage terminase small subunit